LRLIPVQDYQAVVFIKRFCKTAKSDYYVRHVISVCPSFRME